MKLSHGAPYRIVVRYLLHAVLKACLPILVEVDLRFSVGEAEPFLDQ